MIVIAIVIIFLLCYLVKCTGPKASIVKCYSENDDAIFDGFDGRIVRPRRVGERIDD